MALAASSPAVLSFLKATQQRRSLRALLPKSPVPDSEIVELAREALHTVPSAFNSQTTRMTVLLGGDHAKVWTIIGDTMKAHIGEERYEAGTKQKMEAFKEGHGTILFWDDGDAVADFTKTCPPTYKDKIGEWVHQTDGMNQYFMWVGLEAYGLGVNLQHYNPLIDDPVRKQWSIPSSWDLRAQMVFGTPKPGSEPGPRNDKYPVDERLAVFGATSARA